MSSRLMQTSRWRLQAHASYTDGPFWVAVVVFLVVCRLWWKYATDSGYFRPLTIVNTGVHEVGHLLFGVIGSLSAHVLGGTLFQLLVPCIVGIIAYKKRSYFVGWLAIIWLWINCLDIAVYMYDATRLSLPMLSMTGDIETTIHDRNFLFAHRWVLEFTDSIAQWVKISGYVLYLFGIGVLGRCLIKEWERIRFSSPYR